MARASHGVLDTSVIIDLESIGTEHLPDSSSITALTLAELASGPSAARTVLERSKRLERLQWVEAMFDAIPFDAAAARTYGRVYAASISAKQKPRGARAIDLLIAATALSRGLPLYTRNAAGFAAVAAIMNIVEI